MHFFSVKPSFTGVKGKSPLHKAQIFKYLDKIIQNNPDIFVMKHYFVEINESKSLLLLDILPIYAGLVQKHAFSKFQSVDEKCSSGGGNQTKIGLTQKWKDGMT